MSLFHQLKTKKIVNECEEYIIGSLLDVGAGKGYIGKEIQKNCIGI